MQTSYNETSNRDAALNSGGAVKRHLHYALTVAAFSGLLAIGGRASAGDIELAKMRLHSVMRSSDLTGYSDAELDEYGPWFHSYVVQCDWVSRTFIIELPPSGADDRIALFFSTSFEKNTHPGMVSVTCPEGQGCQYYNMVWQSLESLNYVTLNMLDRPRLARLTFTVYTDPLLNSSDEGKTGYVLFYVYKYKRP